MAALLVVFSPRDFGCCTVFMRWMTVMRIQHWRVVSTTISSWHFLRVVYMSVFCVHFLWSKLIIIHNFYCSELFILFISYANIYSYTEKRIRCILLTMLLFLLDYVFYWDSSWSWCLSYCCFLFCIREFLKYFPYHGKYCRTKMVTFTVVLLLLMWSTRDWYNTKV